MTVNEELFDNAVRHQIYTLRLAGGMTNRAVSLLNKVEADIVSKIQKAGSKGSWTKLRMEKLSREIKAINSAVYKNVGKQLTAELIDLAAYEAQFTAAGLQSAIPVQIAVAAPSAALLSGVVKARPFEGKLLKNWVKDLSAAKLGKIQEQLNIGILSGESIQSLTSRIRGTKALNYRDGIMDLGRRQTKAMVRTAVNSTVTGAREEFYKQNEKVIKKVRWVSTLDGKTTHICQSRDGMLFDVDDGPRPPAHIGCRSTVVAVTKSWKELGINLKDAPEGTRASMNGQVPESLNYNQWLKRQGNTKAGRQLQTDVLGKTKAKLFRSGGLSVDKFSDPKGKPYTLKELKRKESKAFKKAGVKLSKSGRPIQK